MACVRAGNKLSLASRAVIKTAERKSSLEQRGSHASVLQARKRSRLKPLRGWNRRRRNLQAGRFSAVKTKSRRGGKNRRDILSLCTFTIQSNSYLRSRHVGRHRGQPQCRGRAGGRIGTSVVLPRDYPIDGLSISEGIAVVARRGRHTRILPRRKMPGGIRIATI